MPEIPWNDLAAARIEKQADELEADTMRKRIDESLERKLKSVQGKPYKKHAWQRYVTDKENHQHHD